MKSTLKSIKASLRTKDVDSVKVEFRGGVFSPTEFTSLFMAILETYTEGLIATNTNEEVFNHFNNVFGIFLNKIVPEEEHYKLSSSHKDLKEVADATLGRAETEEDKMETTENRFSAYLLCRDILIKEIGLAEDSADMILNKRLGLKAELVDPKMTHEKEE